MKLAFFSPVNPQKSGISDYSEELLPWLSQHAQIDLFLKEGVTPTNPAMTDHFSFYSSSEFAQRHQHSPYDLCIYQMGNNTACHRYMDAFIQHYPGIVTLHDYVLHHFYAAMFAQEERFDEYQTAMASYYGALGKKLAEQFRQGRRCNYVFYQLPFFQRVVNPSLGTIVHESYVRMKLLEYNPNYQVDMIPMGISLPDMSAYDMDGLREKYAIPQHSFVLASFGFITEGKRIQELLRVFADFVKEVPEALFLLVGQESQDFDVRHLIHDLRLEKHTRITGYTPYADFLDYIALSDVCMNLRYPTVRATSANILKIMGFAKPVLVSDLCELLDLPDSCCVKIPLDDTEEPALLQALQTLHASPERRIQLGHTARTFVETRHSLQQAADKYLAFCERILARRSSQTS